MQTLDPNELRMLNKILQLLKSDHGIAISPKAGKLAELLVATVSVVDDPVIDAIWSSISPRFHVEQAKLTAREIDPTDHSGDESKHNKKGRYITYRGKKTWVEG